MESISLELREILFRECLASIPEDTRKTLDGYVADDSTR